jgi:hypothetical protein
MSRHLAQLSCADVLVHFAQDVVQLAGSDIALHLFIPFVVFPAMEPGRKFGPLFKRELFDGGLDLVNAHGLNDMQKSLSRQRANGDDGGQRSEVREPVAHLFQRLSSVFSISDACARDCFDDSFRLDK